MSESHGLHWFRRDLRIVGNEALAWSVERHQGRVLGVFCFDHKFLARPDFSANRFQFFLATLLALRESLKEAGSNLLFLDTGPREGMESLFQAMQQDGTSLPATLSWNRDYEPFSVARDAAMERWLADRRIETHHERDHLLVEPQEVFKAEPSQGYQVYTPFAKRWRAVFRSEAIQERVDSARAALSSRRGPSFAPLRLGPRVKRLLERDLLTDYSKSNSVRCDVPIPPAGSSHARERVRRFECSIDAYATARDLPSEDATSRFSLYFKNGSLTTTQVIAAYGLGSKKETKGREKFFSELIWREFFCHVLARFPQVEQSAFQPRYADIAWDNREDWFRAWMEGKTGYPIVDAAMRELRQTGWMHNRARMIVASFLTKDLLIDWRWGERYFMERLLDGDLAANNGGWQWAASTGCDAQPYFRIFNPVLQSRKFDPKGKYIRRFVPELSELGDTEIHEPPAAVRRSYPNPIVDHATQRVQALAMYSKRRA